MYPDHQILGGKLVAEAKTVEACQSACIQKTGCVSLDFVPGKKECYLLDTQEHKTSFSGVDHYDLICDGQYWIYILFIYF